MTGHLFGGCPVTRTCRRNRTVPLPEPEAAVPAEGITQTRLHDGPGRTRLLMCRNRPAPSRRSGCRIPVAAFRYSAFWFPLRLRTKSSVATPNSSGAFRCPAPARCPPSRAPRRHCRCPFSYRRADSAAALLALVAPPPRPSAQQPLPVRYIRRARLLRKARPQSMERNKDSCAPGWRCSEAAPA